MTLYQAVGSANVQACSDGGAEANAFDDSPLGWYQGILAEGVRVETAELDANETEALPAGSRCVGARDYGG